MIDFSGWGFGQIIAMTLWFPVASKYMYLILCESYTTPDIYSLTVSVVGTESYSQARMPESEYTDNYEEKSDEITGDVESQSLQSSYIVDHICQNGLEAGQ